MEQDLGIYKTTNFEEGWTSGEEIVKLLDKQKQQISVSFFVTAMTLIYESEVRQFGKFNESEKMGKCLGTFFASNAKILVINTSQTLLSSIKILQYIDTKKDYIVENGRICLNLDILKSEENRDNVAKAFELERNVLLVIEYRHTVKEQDLEEFYQKLYNVVNDKPNKKIILIMHQDECNSLLAKIKNDSQNKDKFMLDYDIIDIKDFEPKGDPFKKEVIIFQEQDKRVSLSNITGINNWNSYVDTLSQEKSEEGIIDVMTLVEILNNDEIEVGSKPAGTSSLEGAYAQMCEEINVETLVNKWMSKEHDNYENDMYIISGISGLSEQDKTDKLIQYLGLNNNKEIIQDQLGDIGSDRKLQIADEPFNDKDFRRLSHNYPEKRIFWICVKYENDVSKFILQEIYSPKFYLKRKFKNVIIKKDLKEHLIKGDLSELFIVYCAENKRELYKCMKLNEREIKQFKENSKITIFSLKSDAEAAFKVFSKQNQTVHFLELEEKLLVWCDSHGSVQSLQRYIDYERCETSLVEEDNLIRKIKDRKVVILADDPGMGKTTSLIKLYETESESSSIVKSNWVIRIQLRDNLKDVRDLELKKDHIDIASVVAFLSKIDLKLNNQLAKSLMATALDKSKHFPKSLLLAFDGFDEILDEEDRNRIILLLKFIKKKTTSKLWITTRLRFKEYLENELSTIAVEFVPMDDRQKSEYIKTYLQHRLYLILNEKNFNGISSCSNDWEEIKSIHMYISEFLNKMKKTFEGNISRFIGTPLQLHLMLEGSSRHFKSWIEKDDDKIPVFNYVGHDINEVYENFIDRKYDVYFEKLGIPEDIQRRQEKNILDQHHKNFAKFRILAIKPKTSFDEFLDKILLAGIIKFEVSYSQFIHKTFEEFFAAKVFVHWIEKEPNHLSNTNKRKHLLKVILMNPNYQLIRTFMNLQLQKMTEQDREGRGQNEIDESYANYGNIAAKLLNEENSPCIVTTLHIAVEESNKDIVCFLLKSLKRQPDALRVFLFAVGEYTTHDYFHYKGTALHVACSTDDLEIVKVLLDAAEEISEDTLQEFLKCLNHIENNALIFAAHNSHNIKIFNELWSRANNKLDLILTNASALCIACFREKEEFVDLLLQELEHDKHSLKQLLLYKDQLGNALCYASSSAIVEKLISASKSMEDNNETLKKLLLPKKGHLPLNSAVSNGNIDVVEMLLNVAKEVDDDNHMLKKLLLEKSYGESSLHVAAKWGHSNIIKLLLDTASDLGIEILEKLITAVDRKDNNAIQLLSHVNRIFSACDQNDFEIIKELLSRAMNMDDEGATLKKILKKLKCLYKKSRYRIEIQEIIESLILEAKNNNRIHAVSILKEFKEQLIERKPLSVRLNLLQRIFRRIRSSFRRDEIRGSDKSLVKTPSDISYFSTEEYNSDT